MGFVKRNIELEEFLDSVGAEWDHLSDREYKDVMSAVNVMLGHPNNRRTSGDDAFRCLEGKLPITGYIYSAPDHKLLSLQGRKLTTFGYSVRGLASLDRASLNAIECVISDRAVTFACMLNHEWQSHCPEAYFETST